MTEKHIYKAISGMFLLMTVFCLVYIFVEYGNQDTLTIGIYCGSNWDVPGTDQYAFYQKAIDKFHEKYPNIKVEYEGGVRNTDYSQWLGNRILAGNTPDIFVVLPEDFLTLANAGVLKNLNAEIIKDNEFQSSLFYPVAYETGKEGNIQYTLPMICNPRLMFVNKSLLQKEGLEIPSEEWTWDDFYEICQKVVKDNDNDGSIDQYGYYDYTWLDAAYANNILPFSSDGSESHFTDEKMIEAISFVKKLENVHGNVSVSSNDFDLGNVAFRPLSFAEYRTYMPYPWRIKKYSGFQWTCIDMPKGTSGINRSSMETVSVAMSSTTNKEGLAWEFMKILTMDPDIQYAIFEDTSGVSPLKEVTRSDKVMYLLSKDTPGDSDMDLSLLDKVMTNAVVPTKFSNYDTAMQYADQSIEKLLSGDEEMNLYLYQLKNKLNKLLKSNNSQNSMNSEIQP